MFDTFREPHFFTFSVIFSHIASIFTFSVEFFSHLATFSHIAAFSHLLLGASVSSRIQCFIRVKACPHDDTDSSNSDPPGGNTDVETMSREIGRCTL